MFVPSQGPQLSFRATVECVKMHASRPNSGGPNSSCGQSFKYLWAIITTFPGFFSPSRKSKPSLFSWCFICTWPLSCSSATRFLHCLFSNVWLKSLSQYTSGCLHIPYYLGKGAFSPLGSIIVWRCAKFLP